MGPYAVAVPVAVFLLALWGLQLRAKRGLVRGLFPAAAALVLVAPWLPTPIDVIAGLLVVLVAVTLVERHRTATRTA